MSVLLGAFVSRSSVQPLGAEVIIPISSRRVRRVRPRRRGEMRGRGGESRCWRCWRLQVIPWSPPLPESYILPTLVLALIAIYIIVAVSFYNSSVV